MRNPIPKWWAAVSGQVRQRLAMRPKNSFNWAVAGPRYVRRSLFSSRSMGDWAASAATAAGRSRCAGEQDGAHRLGGDAAREGIPAQGYGSLVTALGLELAREQ